VTIVYVPLQLLSLAWASSAVSNAEELGSDVRRTALPRRDKGAGRVANGRTYPYLRGDLGQAARGGLGGGGRLGGSKGRLSGGAEACLASLASPRGR